MGERIVKAAVDLKAGDMLVIPWGTTRVMDIVPTPYADTLEIRTSMGGYTLAPFAAVVVETADA